MMVASNWIELPAISIEFQLAVPIRCIWTLSLKMMSFSFFQKGFGLSS